jgi:opacity protein-like surface antigen
MNLNTTQRPAVQSPIYSFTKSSYFFLTALTLVCLLNVESARAQADSTSRAGWYGFGGVGPAVPLGAYGSERSAGIDLNTAVDYRFASGFLMRGMLDFSSFGFNRGTITQESNGKVYALSGNNNLISLNFSAGYYFSMNRFTPYFFGGPGYSWISKPRVSVDTINGYIDLDSELNGYISLTAGGGLDYILTASKKAKPAKSIFILYTEFFYTYIPTLTETSSHHLSLVSFNIGLKSKF